MNNISCKLCKNSGIGGCQLDPTPFVYCELRNPEPIGDECRDFDRKD
jgi:hypothetical protein